MMKNTGSELSFVEDGGVTSPKGFKAAGVCAGLKKSGKPDMALIVSEKPADFAGAFTSNLFPAAPVQLCRERVLAKGLARAIVANSGNANACTGLEGYKNAVKMAELTAAELSIPAEQVLVASTGRIGVQLPMERIAAGVKAAAKALSPKGGAEATAAVMTTDTRPKEVAVSFSAGGRTVTIGGLCKGAGMIAPGMKVPHATMLCFIASDAAIRGDLLAELLEEAVEGSFNKIAVDNDMSTNDTVLVLANGCSGVEIKRGGKEAATFKAALSLVAEQLARSIVLDGEGVTKFISVEVEGAASEEDAKLCARAIANSMLCKTAWFGCDPNWGRVLAAAGYSGAKFSPEGVSLDYDEFPVVRNGIDAGTPEEQLAEVLKRPEVSVKLNLGEGPASFSMWTGDISYEYVKINADYHT